jgi:hypothetical protein
MVDNMGYIKNIAIDLSNCESKIDFIHYIIDNNLFELTKGINYLYNLDGCIYGIC